MTALSRIWDTGLGAKELCAMGEELGADVPFCILTQNTGYGLALCTGTGASLTPLRSRFKRAVLLVKPHFGVSTREVYQNIDSCSIEKRPDTDMLVKALRNNSHRHIYSNMINVLEEYTLKHYPEVEKIKEMIEKETSAEKVLMTGQRAYGIRCFQPRKKRAGSVSSHAQTRIFGILGYDIMTCLN